MYGIILALVLLVATIANVVALVGHADPFAPAHAALPAVTTGAAAHTTGAAANNI
jgi:hypothetical protein